MKKTVMHFAPGFVKALPVAWTLAGLFVGLALEQFVVARLARALEAAGRRDAAHFAWCFRGPIAIWTTALGIRATMLSFPDLRPDVATVLDESLIAASILAATIVVARAGSAAVDRYVRGRSEDLPSASLFSSIAVVAVWSIGLLVILQSLGVAIAPVLTALGVGGLAVALALKDTLENLFAGLQIIASNQLRPGDYVRLESGSEGYVSDVTWRNTTVRDLADNLIVVPNAKLAQASFTNFALPHRELTVVVPLLIPYDADLALVEGLVGEAARASLAETKCGVAGAEPFLRFTEFGNENVKASAYLRIASFADQFRVRDDFMKRVLAALRGAGVKAPFPARTGGN